MKKTAILLSLFTFISLNAFADRCSDIWQSVTSGVATTNDIYEKLTKKGEKPYKSTLHKGVNKSTFINICKKNLAKGYTD